MRWIAVFLTTILAANAVSPEQFYGDRSCSCIPCSSPRDDPCCDDTENYHCIDCNDDNAFSTRINLTAQPLQFYGQSYNYAYINTNGIILLFEDPVPSHDVELSSFRNDPFPIEDYVFFAPFYGNIESSDTTESNGTCYSRAGVTDDKLRDKAEGQIQLTGDMGFYPEYLLIATWDYQDDQFTNTFQSVVATNGTTTYAIFLYNNITANESAPAKVGFNDGVHNRSWEMPCSGTEDISMLTSSSNVGEPGVWVFRVDGTDIIPNEGGDPGPPLNLTHDMSANTLSSAVIRWDPPSTTGGDGIFITGYRIMSSDSGLNNEIDGMTYTITGLQYNTNYSVEVTAINSCGQESEPANVVVNIEARVPPTPSLLFPELCYNVPLENGRPVIIKWMSGNKTDGVVYPGVVSASVHLDPGDGTCSSTSTNCTVTITSEGVYNLSLTLTNDVGPSQPVLDMFDYECEEDRLCSCLTEDMQQKCVQQKCQSDNNGQDLQQQIQNLLIPLVMILLLIY